MKQYINGIEVKPTTYKKYAAILESYRHEVNTRGYRMVHDCYEKPSAAKDAAENRICLEMKKAQRLRLRRHELQYHVLLVCLPLPASRGRESNPLL